VPTPETVSSPTAPAVLAELQNLLRRLCEQDRLDLAPETRLDTIPGLDSLRLLQSVAHLEDHFNVEIDAGALEELSVVADIVAAVTGARPLDPTGSP